MSRKKQYKSGSVTITVDYGYDIHSVLLSGRTYNRILAGAPITIKGSGYFNEQYLEQDYWQFNGKEKQKVEPGAVYVYTDEAREVYVGSLDDEEVYIDNKNPA